MRAALVIALAGCSAPHAAAIAPDASSPDAAPPVDAAPVPGTAIVRVHYPLAGHAMTIRGGGDGLTWTTGIAMTATGSDTVEFDLNDLPTAIEWKPLLDDATWARGPNYHVAPGETLDIY
ncbi:MAG TPA: hypothetical protein VGG28_33990, partial [Kofleriaceae bacterium]